MKQVDILGNTLEIGDNIVFVFQLYSNAGLELKKGVIISFTPQNVKVEYKPYPNNDINSDRLVSPNKVAKV